MPSPEFFEALKGKLQTGNAKTIHLNAIPGRLATRLDLDALRQIDEDKPSAFLNELFTKEDFSFKVSFEGIDLANLPPEREKPLLIIAKKLKAILGEHTDNYKEQGIRTFGFGYPIFVKRSNTNSKTVIKSPVFIWSLDIEKNVKAVNSWTIVRDSEKHSVVINPLLRSFLANDEQLTMPEMPGEDITSAQMIIEYCAELLSRCNQQQSSGQYQQNLQGIWQNGITAIPEKSVLEETALNTSARVINSGVFGLFRSPRQQILTELEHVIENQHQYQFERLAVAPFTGSSFSPVQTDPSQQHFLHQLGVATKQIIQGPPGTGKSQSITAIISNALLNGKKCLVVCEKKTAMEVIMKNLHKLNPAIASLAALIEDVQGDRKATVESVRSRAETLGLLRSNYQPQVHKQLELQSAELAQKINNGHLELTKTVAGIDSWPNAVGQYLKFEKADTGIIQGELKRLFPSSQFEFKDGSKELEETVQKLREAEELAAVLSNPNTHELQILNERLFSNSSPVTAEDEVDTLIHLAQPMLQKIVASLDSIDSLLKESTTTLNVTVQPEKAVVKAILPYQPVFSGAQLKESVELSETIRIEQIAKEVKERFERLDASSDVITDKAQKEIIEHYGSVAADIESSLKHYDQDVERHRTAFGKNLYSNSTGLNIKLALFKSFSKNLKLLLQAREEIRSRYAEVIQAFNTSSYFQEIAEPENTEAPANFESSVEKLRAKLTAWKSSSSDRVAEHTSSLSKASVPSLLKDLGDDVGELVQAYAELIKTYSTDLLLAENFAIPAQDIPAIRQNIPNILAYVDKIQTGINSFRTEYRHRAQAIMKLKSQADELVNHWNNSACFADKISNPASLDETRRLVHRCNELIAAFKTAAHEFKDFFRWKHFWSTCTDREKEVINPLIDRKAENNWSEIFTKWYWRTALTKADSYALPDSDTNLNGFREKTKQLGIQQQACILHKWNEAQSVAVKNFERSNVLSITQLYNLRGRNGERRNSLKQIIDRDFELFTSFFPIVMVSPDTASSILPLKEGLFDLVLFDEASQLRLEDTFTSLLRGKIKVVAGDKHQMPPSNAFQSTADAILLQPTDEEIESEESLETVPVSDDQKELNRNADIALADSESLLSYAEDTGYERSYLEVHYRSEHPALIEFSNSAFYGRRLLPMPAQFEYTPIRYIQVDGTYSEQTNRDEARQVVSILANNIRPLADGKYPSVMIATFNIQQRELIRDLIEQRKAEDAFFLSLITSLGDSFEVKNLENVQGDERDIFIISTTFGRKQDGKFGQNLGPISQSKGHRMLNVLVTRAKKQLFVCTSVPVEVINRHATYLHVKGNTGNGIFYAYLAYARAVSNNDNQAAQAMLDVLNRYCADKPITQADATQDESGGFSESIFEEEVYERLITEIDPDRIQQQYKVGGFRIDMVVKPLNNYGRMLAIECDGAKYHSSREAYAHDVFRQEQLEQKGFEFYRIWSSKWWRDPASETAKLIAKIRAHDNLETKADLFSQASKPDVLDTAVVLVNQPSEVNLEPAGTDFQSSILETVAPKVNRADTPLPAKSKTAIQQRLSLEAENPTLFDPVIVSTRIPKSVQKNSIVTVRYDNGVEKRIKFSLTRFDNSMLGDLITVKFDSPVARAILGKKVGDICNLPKGIFKIIDIE